MARFTRPAIGGGYSFARYDRVWSNIGTRVSTKRVALGALRALYGGKAAQAAIRAAERLSGKKR